MHRMMGYPQTDGDTKANAQADGLPASRWRSYAQDDGLPASRWRLKGKCVVETPSAWLTAPESSSLELYAQLAILISLANLLSEATVLALITLGLYGSHSPKTFETVYIFIVLKNLPP